MSNQAAWITSLGARLTVDESPYPTLERDHVIVKNAAVAINPVDYKLQDTGDIVQAWPTIFGCDVAGEVVAVGPGVTNVKMGERVLAHCVSLLSGKHQDAGFQLYTSVPGVLCAPIPDGTSFADASVLPISVSTAAAGLYEESALALPLPSTSAKPTGSAIVVWGASSSVGSSVVQLAVASGLAVVATASKRNFDYVRSLGAEHVLDHSSPAVVEDLVKVLEGRTVVGVYDAIGLPESMGPCAQVLSRVGGGLIVTVLPPPENLPAGVTAKMSEWPTEKQH